MTKNERRRTYRKRLRTYLINLLIVLTIVEGGTEPALGPPHVESMPVRSPISISVVTVPASGWAGDWLTR